MPLVDLPSLNPALPVDTPRGMALTPGALGEDAPRVRDPLDMNPDQPVRPGLRDLFRASFEQENLISSALASEAFGVDPTPDPEYDAWGSIKGTKYEPYFARFAEAANPRQDAAIKADIDREEENRNIIDAAPLWLSMPLVLGASVLDPTILVPGGAFVRGARGGLSVARSALNVGAATAGAVALQEAGLHATQQTRTAAESFVNVSAATLLGGLLGAGGSALLSRAEWNGLTRTMERELNPPPVATGEARYVQRGDQRFVSFTDGSDEFGRITPDIGQIIGRESAPIRLPEGNDGFGEAHIEARHGMEIRMAGYADAADLVRDVTRGFDAIYSARGGRLFLVKHHANDRLAPTAVVELAPADDGAYWAVETAAVYRSEFFKGKERLWSRPGPASSPSADGSPFDPGSQSDLNIGESGPSGNAPGSLGAAATGRPGIGPMSISGAAASATAGATSFLNPGQRLMQSPSATTRDLYMNLGEMTQYIRGNADGMATPQAVETLRQEWDGGLMRAVTAERDAWLRYKQRVGKSRMGREQFDEEIGKALRRGDEHEIPEVAQAAKAYRRDVFDPLLKAAQETGQLPEDIAVETAQSYFSRIYNRHRIEADEVNFRRTVSDWVMQSAPRWIDDFDIQAANKLAKAREKVANASDGGKEAAERALRDLETELRVERDARFGDPEAIRARADEIANEVFQKVTGRWVDPDAVPGRVSIEARGPLKARTFNMPDELLEPWLESNAQMIARRYHRIMSADVELARKFGRADMRDQIAEVKADYARMRQGVTDEKELQKLAKRERADVRDLEGIRDLLRGTYRMNDWEQNFGRMARLANMFNYIRLMGQVTLASVPEAYRTAMTHGLRPFMESSMLALRQAEGFKMAVKEAKDAGNITERAMSHRLATLAEIGDFYTSRGPVEKFMANMTEVASTWNGIRVWTDSMRSIAAVATEKRILENALRFDKASGVNKRYLAYLGVDESMAGRIAKQFDEFGETVDGIPVANAEKWTDEQARRSFRAALNKDIDTQVVTKSVADIPLFANTPLGKLLFQFNSFNLASHQRVLLRGLQEGPARFASGMVAMTSLGMLVTYLQALSSNRHNELPDFAENPGWWIAEGLDKSGLAMVPLQLANTMELLTGINPAKAPITMFDEQSAQSSRLRNRNVLSALGPTAGVIEDIGQVGNIAGRLAQGESPSQGQTRAAERLLPFNSYVGMRQMLKWVVNPPE